MTADHGPTSGMLFDAAKTSPDDFYAVMIQALIPRPIAWVLTRNGDGSHNLAPFSFFNGVSSEPPVLMISVGWKDDGTRKDTWTNIAERSDFVVHIPPASMAEAVVATSASLPHGESELTAAGLSVAAVEGETMPRLVGPKAAFFCARRQIVEVGDQALILGDIRKIWLDDAAAAPKGGRATVDPVALDPLARLGRKAYARLGPPFDLDRPK